MELLRSMVHAKRNRSLSLGTGVTLGYWCITYLLSPPARWHTRQPHSPSTKFSPWLLFPLFSMTALSVLVRSLLFCAMLFFCPPLFLLPSAVQQMASLVMSCWYFRGTWPTHLHFLLAISTMMSACSDISLSSLLNNILGHLILNMVRRHLFTNTLSFRVRSFRSFQHSDPDNSTDFMLLLKILSFVLMVIWGPHWFKMANTWRIWLILDVMSSSVPPDVATMLPRYVKVSTSSNCSPFTCTVLLFLALILITLVFFRLMLRPKLLDVSFSWLVFSWICWWLEEIRHRSSA